MSGNHAVVFVACNIINISLLTYISMESQRFCYLKKSINNFFKRDNKNYILLPSTNSIKNGYKFQKKKTLTYKVFKKSKMHLKI